MDYTTKSCREFVTVLASSEPAPGGGGASALVAALGTALGNMVGSLTVGKKKYADVKEEIKALMKKCDDGAVDTAGKGEQDAAVANLGVERGKLLVNKRLGKLRRGDALHGFWTFVVHNTS